MSSTISATVGLDALRSASVSPVQPWNSSQTSVGLFTSSRACAIFGANVAGRASAADMAEQNFMKSLRETPLSDNCLEKSSSGPVPARTSSPDFFPIKVYLLFQWQLVFQNEQTDNNNNVLLQRAPMSSNKKTPTGIAVRVFSSYWLFYITYCNIYSFHPSGFTSPICSQCSGARQREERISSRIWRNSLGKRSYIFTNSSSWEITSFCQTSRSTDIRSLNFSRG